MPLIKSEDYEKLPADETRRWLKLRDIADSRIEQRYDAAEGGYNLSDMIEYVEVISAAADTLSIQGLPEIAPANIADDFHYFKAKVAGIAAATSLLMQNVVADTDHLQISKPVKERLQEQVGILRTIITESQFELKKMARLNGCLDHFEKSLDRNEISYRETLKALAYIAAGLGGSTAFLADAPEAFATINQLIGLQQEAADEKAEMLLLPFDPAIPKLPSPYKLLPPPADNEIDQK